MKPEPCPTCKNRVVWRSVEPRSPELICQKCGLVFPIPTREFACTWGLLEGDWETVEIEKVERYIKSGPNDWTFIKGRRTWSAFRDSCPPDHVISTILLDDMLYWVEIANERPRWRQLYSQVLGKKS